jgi:hypothetical protein
MSKRIRGRIFQHRTKESLLKDIRQDKLYGWRSCHKKKVYLSYEDAYDKSVELNSEEDCRNYQEPYKCELCEFYHIGRSLKKYINSSFVKEQLEEELMVTCGFTVREAHSIVVENMLSEKKKIRSIKNKGKIANYKARFPR